MIEVSELTVASVQTSLIAAFIVFLRVGAAMALLPAFGERTVPMRVRLALTLAFTLVVFPLVGERFEGVDTTPRSLAAVAAVEVAAGLALGIAFRLVVVALQIAGTIAANMTSLSQLLGGVAVDPQPAISQILVLAGLALATLVGLHVRVAEALAASYDVIGPAHPLLAEDLAEWGTAAVAHTFGLGFVLAAPFTIAGLIYNLALGAINRAMPQLMVAFVGAPAITGGALALMLVVSPLLLEAWLQTFEAVLAAPFGTR